MMVIMGFIYSNSLDLIHGKKPYNEIFLEYGLLQSLINLIIIKFINNSVYSIQAFTVINLCIFIVYIK